MNFSASQKTAECFDHLRAFLPRRGDTLYVVRELIARWQRHIISASQQKRLSELPLLLLIIYGMRHDKIAMYPTIKCQIITRRLAFQSSDDENATIKMTIRSLF